MKNWIVLSMGLGLAASASAKTLPTAPEGCIRDLQTKNFCSAYEAPALRGPITVKFFATVDKASYPTIDDLLERYTDFEAWPAYVESTGRTDVIFNSSEVLPSIPATDSSPEILRHYADYQIDSVIGYQDVRVVTHNIRVDDYPGALGSIEFEVQTSGSQPVPAGEPALEGAVGVQQQTGSVHAVDCINSDLCADDQYLLVYESTITPAIDLLPNLAARSITRGVESILIGMFLMDQGGDDDIL